MCAYWTNLLESSEFCFVILFKSNCTFICSLLSEITFQFTIETQQDYDIYVIIMCLLNSFSLIEQDPILLSCLLDNNYRYPS